MEIEEQSGVRDGSLPVDKSFCITKVIEKNQ